MVQRCTVCTHPQLAEIDAAVIGHTAPVRRIAVAYNLAETSLRRHNAAHLPDTLRQAHDAAEIARADSLLDQVQNLQTTALRILQMAEAAKDLKTALGAIREARGNLELRAKLLGKIESPQINLVISPEWVSLRTTILASLERYPEARQSIVEALNGHSS